MMKNDMVSKLKKLNRDILRRRLSQDVIRRKFRSQPIQEGDILDLTIALKSCDSFDELYELIDMM